MMYNDYRIPDAPYIREAEARGTDYMEEFLGFCAEAEDHPGFFEEDFYDD